MGSIIAAAACCPLDRWEKPAAKRPGLPRRLVHGAIGLLRWVLHIARVDPAGRLRVCHACPERRWGGFCAVCGCWLRAKAGDADESCPLGKW